MLNGPCTCVVVILFILCFNFSCSWFPETGWHNCSSRWGLVRCTEHLLIFDIFKIWLKFSQLVDYVLIIISDCSCGDAVDFFPLVRSPLNLKACFQDQHMKHLLRSCTRRLKIISASASPNCLVATSQFAIMLVM